MRKISDFLYDHEDTIFTIWLCVIVAAILALGVCSVIDTNATFTQFIADWESFCASMGYEVSYG